MIKKLVAIILSVCALFSSSTNVLAMEQKETE